MDVPVRMTLQPNWECVRGAWDVCVDGLRTVGLDADTVNALAMIAQELLENAVKYGTFGAADERIELAVAVDGATATVEVKHPVDGADGRLRQLDYAIQWIRGFQDPFEAYVSRLKEVASRSYSSGHGGLGLVRIAYEGQSILDFYVNDANILAISAVHRLPIERV